MAKRGKQKKLFDLDELQRQVHEAITSDLSHFTLKQDSGSSLPLSFAASRQIADFSKKFEWSDTDKTGLEEEAFAKFRECNLYMKRVNRMKFPTGNPRFSTSFRAMPFQEKVHRRAKAIVAWVLGDFSMEEWFAETRHSNGSSIGVPFRDTSLNAKSTYPLTCTAAVVPLFEQYLAFDPHLRVALEKFNARAEKPRYQLVEGSRATTVSKTSLKRRFICVEPTLNMFFQQGLMQMMYKRLKLAGLDVERLPLQHGQRAHKASLTRREATIDWSHASDSVGIEIIRWLLPAKWFLAVKKVRCSHMLIGKSEEYEELHVFSTMGNATTFPLETLCFWAYAHAVRLSLVPGRSLFPEWEDLRTVSAFGDDCIVPSAMANDYITVMEGLGFVVNNEKTHHEKCDPFRESCGADYIAGYPCRPVSPNRPASTKPSIVQAWLYSVINGVTQKYIQYFGTRDYWVGRELYRLVGDVFERNKWKIYIVPPYMPDDSGLKEPDIFRVARHYRWGFAPIGYCRKTYSYSFRFLRHAYLVGRSDSRSKIIDANLGLANWLKRPAVSEPLVRMMHNRGEWDKVYKERRYGGYVVAKGCSSCWELGALEGHLAEMRHESQIENTEVGLFPVKG